LPAKTATLRLEKITGEWRAVRAWNSAVPVEHLVRMVRENRFAQRSLALREEFVEIAAVEHVDQSVTLHSSAIASRMDFARAFAEDHDIDLKRFERHPRDPDVSRERRAGDAGDEGKTWCNREATGEIVDRSS
jgi:hypothetical protein